MRRTGTRALACGREHERGGAAGGGGRHREAGVRRLEQLATEARVRTSVRDALVADCRARAAMGRSTAVPMQPRLPARRGDAAVNWRLREKRQCAVTPASAR